MEPMDFARIILDRTARPSRCLPRNVVLVISAFQHTSALKSKARRVRMAYTRICINCRVFVTVGDDMMPTCWVFGVIVNDDQKFVS